MNNDRANRRRRAVPALRRAGTARHTAALSAFTLLELLLAVAIAAVLAVSLMSALHIAIRARNTAEAALRPGRGAEAALAFVRADLESALPPRGVFAGTFSGTDWRDSQGRPADSVVFYTAGPAPMYAGGSGGDIKKVEITPATLLGSGERALLRRVSTNLLSPVLRDPDEEILGRGVVSFNLRYFDGTVWLDYWDSSAQEDVLPLAVEVTLEMEPADPARDPLPRRFTRVVAVSCVGKPPVEEPERNATGEPPPPGEQQGPPGPGGTPNMTPNR